MTTTPPPVIRITEQEALDQEIRHIIIMGKFALILASAGYYASEQTLERLADVAIGDV